MGDVELRPDKTALLLIDLQMEYFVPGRPLAVPDGERVLANCKALLDAFRAAGSLVIHIRHESPEADDSTFAPGSPYLAIHSAVLPTDREPVLLKQHPGAFYQTELETMLRSAGVDTVVIAGLLAFLCCDTTAREAEARGFHVYLVGDAMDSLDLGGLSHLEVTEAVLAIQDFAFARVLNTEDVLRPLKTG